MIDGPATAPAGTTWSGGVLEVKRAGVVLDHVFVKGGIDYDAAGTLTITNSIVEGNANAQSAVLGRRGHLEIRDSTLRWKGGPPQRSWGNGVVHGDSTMTLLRNDISGAPDGIQNGPGNSRIEQNHIHDLAMLGSSDADFTHNDGIQSYGGPNLVIRNNRIDIRDADGRAYDGKHQNGAVFVQPGGDAVSSNLQVVDNFLAGGGFTLRLEGPMRGAVVSGNRFGPTTGGWGEVLVDETGVQIATWSDNLDNTGRALARPV